MIILFSTGGRTGNQLFQLSYAMSKRREREWIISFGFEKTRPLLSWRCKRHWASFQSHGIVYPILYYVLVKTSIASLHSDTENRASVRLGRMQRIVLMKGFFESSREQSRDLADFFCLKQSLRSRVRPFLAALLQGRTPIFVHIRRSDLMQSSLEIKRMLPDRYYEEAVRVMRQRYPTAFFVIVGDDPPHAESLFRDLEPKFVSRFSVPEDLALMSLCQGGVLSNSTFAWWGAFFGGGRLSYIAPKYWSGFKKGFWYPPEIRAGFMTDFVDVHGS